MHKLNGVLAEWRKELTKLYMKDPESEDVRAVRDRFSYNIDYFEGISYEKLDSIIEVAYVYLRKLLHGRVRLEMKCNISEAVKARTRSLKQRSLEEY
jgi:DNA-dependent RNA polymerase auxiliary subunit epsilon